MTTAKKDNGLMERLTQFATDVLLVAGGLPDTSVARQIAGNLVSSSMQPAYAYVDAQQARSRDAFIAGMRVCLLEVQNALVALYVLEKLQLVRNAVLTPLFEEAEHLSAIFAKR